jgi:hypothetical protein
MKVFYRYIRPHRFNEKRCELTTLPQGGICLRFEELPKGDFFFTYSRCHSNEHFNKEVARAIADERAAVAKSDGRVLKYLRFRLDNQSTDLLVQTVLLRIQQMEKEAVNDAPLISKYMQLEYSKFAVALRDVHTNNMRQKDRYEAWKRAVINLWKSTYGSQSK